MAKQLLQGIQVIPKGTRNKSRFSSSLVNGEWVTGFAFGGWIYNASVSVGFSAQPSEIRMGIVLEVIDKVEKYTFFDINDTDLKCDAGDGGDESLYDINFNGLYYSDFVLYEYNISVENGAKILNLIFRDYSIILDKIYVGLIKRQGNYFVHSSSAQLSFPIRCSDCELQGGSFNTVGTAYRDISYGSYVGINGNAYDNFSNIDNNLNLFQKWVQLFSLGEYPTKFDLNGGYLILGTEEATEERCGNLANVYYNFNELLASLRVRGLNFTGSFPIGIQDSDYVYKQNYIGTLREVLQQWCADLGYDFYCNGRDFIGINLTKPLDISKTVEIADPTTEFGSQFSLNKSSAILSYKYTSSLNNTFRQSVITANNRARDSRTDSKSVKRYVGILPLHPIDFNSRSNKLVIRKSALGNWFYDIAWANNFEFYDYTINSGETISTTTDRAKTLNELDGRTYSDIDTCIALSKYDQTLRDIYCQDRAIYGETDAIRNSNFKALGYVPLIEITGEEKSTAIEALVSSSKLDEVSNLCIDKRFYKVYIGYYYPSFKQDIINWERTSAESLYNYGIITDGLLNHFPYMPANSLGDLSPTAGFYGESGTSLLRTDHTIEPSCQQYFQLRDAPFKDLILYSGLFSSTQEKLPLNIDPLYGQNIYSVFDSGNLFPQGLFYAKLDNDWGTDEEEFKRIISLNLNDACVDEFKQEPSYTNITNEIDKKYQDWRLDYFKPVETADIKNFYNEYGDYFKKIEEPDGSIFDRNFQTYYNLHYKENAICSKLHIIVLTDTRSHPNIYVNFKQHGTKFVNPVVLRGYLDKEREAVKRRLQTKTQSICDISILQEMCKSTLSGYYNSNTGDAKYRCIIDEDKYNFLEEGFTFAQLLKPNSRGLEINITKNPLRNNDLDKLSATFKNSDVNGDFYYSDILSNLINTYQSQANINIIYPVSTLQSAGYRGVLTSQIDWENRIPETVEIYGTPANFNNNNSATVRVINNQVDPDLQPQLDPYLQKYMSYMTVITGDAQIVTTVEQYHNLIKNINSYQLTGAMKSVELSLAGTPNDFDNFKNYLSPIYGLNKLEINIGDNGVITNLSYADRPPVLPKSETILNKISPRIVK